MPKFISYTIRSQKHGKEEERTVYVNLNNVIMATHRHDGSLDVVLSAVTPDGYKKEVRLEGAEADRAVEVIREAS